MGKTAGKIAVWSIGSLFAAIVMFLLAAWVGSALPRNSGWTEPKDGIEIMVQTNGVHTAIVMPLVTAHKDWRQTFPAPGHVNGDFYTHVAVSWGERDVFLHTPTWADLTPGTAFGALISGDSLLHVTHLVRPRPAESLRPFTITRTQYARLVARIENAIPASGLGAPYRGYTGRDVFYDAAGTYHIGNTCNQWTSDTLAHAGIETGRWTPFAGGVMKWIDMP